MYIRYYYSRKYMLIANAYRIPNKYNFQKKGEEKSISERDI